MDKFWEAVRAKREKVREFLERKYQERKAKAKSKPANRKLLTGSIIAAVFVLAVTFLANSWLAGRQRNISVAPAQPAEAGWWSSIPWIGLLIGAIVLILIVTILGSFAKGGKIWNKCKARYVSVAGNDNYKPLVLFTLLVIVNLLAWPAFPVTYPFLTTSIWFWIVMLLVVVLATVSTGLKKNTFFVFLAGLGVVFALIAFYRDIDAKVTMKCQITSPPDQLNKCPRWAVNYPEIEKPELPRIPFADTRILPKTGGREVYVRDTAPIFDTIPPKYKLVATYDDAYITARTDTTSEGMVIAKLETLPGIKGNVAFLRHVPDP